MTRDEIKQILMVVTTTYPNWKPEDMTNTVNVWTAIFKEYDARIIQKALMKYIQSDIKGFAPVPGQIIACIDTGYDYMNGEEAWSLVYKAICNSNYNSETEYKSLPIECQKAIGSAGNLRYLAMMDIETVQSVEKSHFLKTYANVITEMKREIQSNPYTANISGRNKINGQEKELSING